MANTTVTIYCKPTQPAAQPQAAAEPALADGVCRPDSNAPAIDFGDVQVLNPSRSKKADPVLPAVKVPDAKVGGVSARTPRGFIGPMPDPRPTAHAAADRAAVPDTAPAEHRPVAEPALGPVPGPQVDVVVDETGKIIPKNDATPAEKRAIEQAGRMPGASGDAVLALDKAGLAEGLYKVLEANPSLVANAAEQGVNADELRAILAEALWPDRVSSGGDRFAIPLRTYPGAYAAMFDAHMAAKASGNDAMAGKMLDGGAAIAQTGMENYVAQGDTWPQARERFAGNVVQVVDQRFAFFQNPANRAALADPTTADRARPWSAYTTEEKRAVASGIDRGYRAAGYDPSDEEPLYADDIGSDVAMAEGGASVGLYAEVHQAARENARRQERQATANRERIRSVNLQNDRDHGVRIARRRDMDIFAYRGRVVPGTMTAALRDPFRRTL